MAALYCNDTGASFTVRAKNLPFGQNFGAEVAFAARGPENQYMRICIYLEKCTNAATNVIQSNNCEKYGA
jgi:hypothetical protein